MKQDFYKLLGLKTKEPTEAELKKAYKKAAMKHHPDKNQSDKEAAEERFKKVAEAYSVLSDPQKKAIYDQYGEEGLSNAPPPATHGGGGQGGMPPGFSGGGGMPGGFSFGGPGGGGQQFVFQSPGGGGGIDPHDLFAQLFGGQMGGMGGDDFSGMMGGGMGGRPKRSRAAPKPSEVVHNLSCTLEELYSGTTRKLKVTRQLLDAQSGRSIPTEKVLQIDVKAGWKGGTKIRYNGEGDERPGRAAQDLVFVVREKPHAYFERKGNDLHYVAKLTQGQASKGVKVNIPTLDGRSVKVQEPAGIRNNAVATVQGEGMPMKGNSRGDLVVKFQVATAASCA